MRLPQRHGADKLHGCCQIMLKQLFVTRVTFDDRGLDNAQDMTETDVINLRRVIYLTIMSSMDFEEAGHKLTKIPLEPGQEMEIVTMILECCSQEKTYIRCVSGLRF